MANIINYIREYGDKTYKDLEYNEVDNVIFSMISYVNFDKVLSKKSKKITLKEAVDKFFEIVPKKEIKNNMMGFHMTIKVLKVLKDKKRYRDLLLYNYDAKKDKTTQFSGLFIDISEDITYVSFEGTDDLVSGWKEDFEISYHFPTKAQRQAIKYVNSKIKIFSKRKYILGGHSKGGNLALAAGMYANPLVRRKIVKIISNDGPGLIQKQIESKFYKKIDHIYDLYVPDNSVVGLLFCHKDEMNIVKTNKKGIFSHDCLSWQVDGTKFIRTRLSNFSKGLDQILTKWMSSYNFEEKKKFTQDLFLVFERANIDSLIDVKYSLPNIIKVIKETKNIDSNSKKMLKDFVDYLIDYIKTDYF